MPKEFAHYYKAEIIKETRARANIEEECCFLGGYSGNTKFFGHFIYEFLFRLFAFEKCGLLDRFPLAVYEGIPDSWLSFIELYGLPKDRILKIPQYPAPLFRNVWVTSSPIAAWMPGYSYWDEGIREVRERLLAAAGRVGGDGPKRIFIGRRDAAHRRLLNEAEVWAFLKTQGFEYIEFAGKTAAEQVRLVRSAEIVVTVAGSASAMTAFAPLDSIIISMQPANLGGAFGPMGVATVLGQTYERLPRAMSQDSPNDGVDVDFVVTLGEVQDVVQQAIRLTESHRPNPKSLQSPN